MATPSVRHVWMRSSIGRVGAPPFMSDVSSGLLAPQGPLRAAGVQARGGAEGGGGRGACGQFGPQLQDIGRREDSAYNTQERASC